MTRYQKVGENKSKPARKQAEKREWDLMLKGTSFMGSYLHMGNGALTSSYPKETMVTYFYFPPENKVIVARYGDFLERDLISQEFSGRDCDLEDDHIDTLPPKNTSRDSQEGA
ncbi:hypothetical protein Tco_0981799 [Tanacetum coccineum]